MPKRKLLVINMIKKLRFLLLTIYVYEVYNKCIYKNLFLNVGHASRLTTKSLILNSSKTSIGK